MEDWKDIEGFEGYYTISNWGNVYSCTRYVNNRLVGGKILKPGIDSDGYKIVTLCDGNAKRKTRTVHRLVAEAFVDNIIGGNQVNHIDGNKLNNSYTNLEWCDSLHNIRHAIKSGLKKVEKGDNPFAKSIKFKSGNRVLHFTCQELAAEYFGVSRSLISLNKKLGLPVKGWNIC